MKKRKLICTITGVMIGTSMLIGCGGDKNVSKQSSSKTDGNSSQEIKATEPKKIPTTAKNRSDTLIVGSGDFSGNFNPIYASSAPDMTVSGLIFDGMVKSNKEGEAEGSVAQKWEISEDNKTYTFNIKKGVKFSNGEELKASDIAFTYTALCDPNYDGARSSYVENLVGYKDYKDGNASNIKGIKVIDDYTISFTLTNVDVTAIWNFGLGIMPKSVYDFPKGKISKMKELFLKPIGVGAYKFVKYKPGQEVDLTSSNNYFQGEPKIKNIILKFTNAQTSIQELMAGDIDINDNVSANPENIQQIKSAGFMDIFLIPSNGYSYIGFNLKDKMFEDKKVRQALTYGLDRKGFCESYYKGYAVVIDGPIPPTSWAYDSNISEYEYSPEKAEKLLDEAGWKKGSDGIREKDGKKLAFSFSAYTGSKFVEALIPILKEDYKKIGVEVTPELMDFASLVSKTDKGDFETYVMAWNLAVDPDQSDFFLSNQAKSGGFNRVHFINKDSDNLLNEQRKEMDKEKRKELLFKWQNLMNKELPYIFLTQNKNCTVVSSRVENVKISIYESWNTDIQDLELKN